MQNLRRSFENKKAASDSVKITIIVVVAVVVLALIAMFLFVKPKLGTTINANGISNVKATPDLVSIYFSVETNASTATEAKDKNAEIVDKVITDLLKKGIDRKDISTENFYIYPEYDWRSDIQELKGYKATHSIKVTLSASKMDDAGDVVDVGVDAGAMISYINFELSQEKQNEYKALALKQATQDAKIKAESIASGLGKRVGDVVSISDSGFDYYPWPVYRNDMMAVGSMEAKSAISTNITPGEQDITARVNVVFKII